MKIFFSIIFLVLLGVPSFARQVADTSLKISDTVITDTVVKEEAEDTGSAAESTYEVDTPVLRQVPDTTVARLKKQEEFAYANDPEYWVKEPVEIHKEQKGIWDYVYDFFHQDGVRVIVWILLGALILYILYRAVVVNKLYLVYSSRKKRGQNEHPASDIEDDQLDEKIRRSMEAKNYRESVRLMYLKSLQLLNEKGWIAWHAQTTNYEYVNQVSKYPAGRDFAFLTQVYDYVWYGEFTLTDEQMKIVHNSFNEFYKTLNS